jgi:hypothetical protein
MKMEPPTADGTAEKKQLEDKVGRGCRAGIGGRKTSKKTKASIDDR